ncbi:MAG TPA: siphovirus Gp157 family protein [Anaeromyxobacteraceae bacterium]|nr:siphovirus Gp157 family protein [Anaeromyxobacteraceae bacterium]
MTKTTKTGTAGVPAATAEELAARPRNRTLFEIGEDLLALEDLLVEQGGDVTDEQIETILDGWLRDTQGDLSEKVDRYASLIQELRARAAVRANEAQRIADRARVDENAAKKLTERLLVFMQAFGKKTIEGLRYRTSIVGNGGKQPLEIVEGTAATDVPLRFRKVTITISAPNATLLDIVESYVAPACEAYAVEQEIDKARVRAALEAGEVLPFAKLNDRGVRLSIK